MWIQGGGWLGGLDAEDILGTTNQVVVTDNGDGTVTLSLPQAIDTDADVEFDSTILGDLTASRMVSTDASKKIVSITDLTAWILGTTNQVAIVGSNGTVTLSLPQSINTDADVEFDSAILDDLTASRMISADANKKIISIADLTAWILGTANQITATNLNGTAVLSFPNAVTIPGSISITGQLLASDGTVALPSLSFWEDPNSGWYRTGADAYGFATGGVLRLSVDATGRLGIPTVAPTYKFRVKGDQVTVSGDWDYQRGMGVQVDPNSDLWTTGKDHAVAGVNVQTLAAGGVGAAETLTELAAYDALYGTFTNFPANSIITNVFGIRLWPYVQAGTITNLYGLYIRARGGPGIVTNEWGVYQDDDSPNLFKGRIRVHAGTVALPSFTFHEDFDTGMYRVAADILGFSTAGVERLRIGATGSLTLATGQILAPTAGTYSAPAYSFGGDPDTGIYRDGGNFIGITTGGSARVQISYLGIMCNTGGDASTPGIRILDADTGIFRPGTDIWAISTAGVERMRVGATGIVQIGGASDYLSVQPDGEVALTGTARVTKIQQIHLSAMKKGVGSPPGDGVKDGFPTYDFDDSVDEEVFFSFTVPDNYDFTTDMSIHLQFFVDTAPVAAAGVYWAIEWKAVAAGEAIDFTTGTTTLGHPEAITTGTPANDALRLDCEDIEGGANAMAAGDLLLCRLYRDVSNGGDTFTGDVRLIGSHVHFIANKLGVAT